MKNIHVLPTDKPSRVYHWKGNDTYEGGLRIRRLAGFCDFNSTDTSNQHIYITSDEEIKEGACVLDLCEDLGLKYHPFKVDKATLKYANQECKKIILTTDQDLDGVQAIPDEFLEWFVKNPSCEEVEVVDDWNSPRIDAYEYKIIYPKEEPKKYPIGGYAPGSYSCKCVTCNNMFMGDKRAYQCEPCATKIDNFFTSFPSKQETLEEASWKHNPLKKLDGEFVRHAFKEGAKWQAKRMFSEQDMIEFAEWIANSKLHGYSKQLYEAMIIYKVKTTKELLELWKERFKNKQ